MKARPSPALVGAFVLGGLALGSAALLVFGGRNPLRTRRRVVVYFDESVAGLERGAAVKLRGVYSGRVSSLVPMLSPDSRRTVVAAICDLGASALLSPEGKPVDLSQPSVLKGLVDEGLRARLKPAGLSGEYIVELDFYDPARYPARPAPDWAAGALPYPSIPAIPAFAGELLDDLQAVVRQARKADLEGLSRKLAAADIKKTLQQIGDAAAAVKDLADFLERNPNSIISGKKRPAKP